MCSPWLAVSLCWLLATQLGSRVSCAAAHNNEDEVLMVMDVDSGADDAMALLELLAAEQINEYVSLHASVPPWHPLQSPLLIHHCF